MSDVSSSHVITPTASSSTAVTNNVLHSSTTNTIQAPSFTHHHENDQLFTELHDLPQATLSASNGNRNHGVEEFKAEIRDMLHPVSHASRGLPAPQPRSQVHHHQPSLTSISRHETPDLRTALQELKTSTERYIDNLHELDRHRVAMIQNLEEQVRLQQDIQNIQKWDEHIRTMEAQFRENERKYVRWGVYTVLAGLVLLAGYLLIMSLTTRRSSKRFTPSSTPPTIPLSNRAMPPNGMETRRFDPPMLQGH